MRRVVDRSVAWARRLAAPVLRVVARLRAINSLVLIGVYLALVACMSVASGMAPVSWHSIRVWTALTFTDLVRLVHMIVVYELGGRAPDLRMNMARLGLIGLFDMSVFPARYWPLPLALDFCAMAFVLDRFGIWIPLNAALYALVPYMLLTARPF